MASQCRQEVFQSAALVVTIKKSRVKAGLGLKKKIYIYKILAQIREVEKVLPQPLWAITDCRDGNLHCKTGPNEQVLLCHKPPAQQYSPLFPCRNLWQDSSWDFVLVENAAFFAFYTAATQHPVRSGKVAFRVLRRYSCFIFFIFLRLKRKDACFEGF